jgi:5-methylthioadenosine/S-adenosylhomocysteine deaminase
VEGVEGDGRRLLGVPVLPVTAARPQSGLAPAESWALGGCVLMPETALDPGWAVIHGNEIASVNSQQPEGVRCLDTAGIILPGLIDLHGHPNWNIFAAWEPPRHFTNRYAWRDSDEYRAVVGGPIGEITLDWHDSLRLLARYGEVRALVGGTTAIQGDNSGSYTRFREPLVRHVAHGPFGVFNAASLVDPLKWENKSARDEIRAGIESHSITAFYAHVAEGIDDDSRDELRRLADECLLTSATVLIHGTALEDRDFARVREVGAKLVWSPQSNLRLYGTTTRAAAARKLGIPLGLGADWLPTGSVGLLAEMKVARRILSNQGAPIDARDLVAMVTVRAAEIADLADNLGRIAEGRPADVLVLERHHDDPYESVCRAGRTSVELVVIDGRLVYGRDDWFSELVPEATLLSRSTTQGTGERIWAWGKRMRLDLGSPADPATLGHEPGPPLPRHLSGIRADLIERFPHVGPIFA